jgi:hypothetical protein
MSTPRTRPEGQARDVEGNFRETLGVARIVTAAAHAGTSVERLFAVLNGHGRGMTVSRAGQEPSLSSAGRLERPVEEVGLTAHAGVVGVVPADITPRA